MRSISTLVVAVVIVSLLAFPARLSADSKGLMFGGLALVGGGAVMAVLASTSAKSTNCAAIVGFGFAYACAEETNRGLLFAGAGLSGLGATLMTIGAQKQIAIGPRRIQFRWKF